MPIKHNAQDHELPPELRARMEAAHVPLVDALHKRLNTPVPGNPHGGFPGINLVEHRNTVIGIRRQVIDQWNAEHPDSIAIEHAKV